MREVFARIRLAANAQTRTSGATWCHVLRAFYCSVFSAVVVSLLLPITGCSSKPSADTLVMIIESSPTNLDPRVGIDAQSERIDELIFDALLTRDEHLNVQPGLAERWDVPDPLTYIFHLHSGVKFHDGRRLTSRDVKWTFDSLQNGTIRSTKTSTYRFVDHIDAPDDLTVTFHLKEKWASLLWNLSEGAIGIVPYGSGGEISQKPIGSGPFRFVSAETDRNVEIARNPDYWGVQARVPRIRFQVVPDMTTQALELRKGTADIAINALTPDMVLTLEHQSKLEVLRAPGTVLAYLAFNLRDPILRDVRVRQALAYAIDRRPFIEYLLRGFAQPARSTLPVQSWAYTSDVRTYPYDPNKANQILDAAGYKPVQRIRFHLAMKTSTDENTRLMVAVLQQQLRAVGIQLDIRTFEFATFYSFVTKGLFQVYSLRWVGGSNEDPDIFEYAFHSARVPPAGANRGFYVNTRVNTLIDQARVETDQNKRRENYVEIQRILADDLPYINLWYLDNVLIHTPRVKNLSISPPGNYDFLKTAELVSQ